MDTLLYQFSYSHYCEKARWALDYKGITYAIKNLLPGMHKYTLSGKVQDTSLPVLRIDGNYIQGSDHIIDYLDKSITTNTLTPTNLERRAEAENWETFASAELATPYAVFYYSHMLEHPHLLRQRACQNGPWYAPLFYAVTFKHLCQRIRDLYQITQHSAEQARERVESGLKKLEQHLQSHSYMVGDYFTRADISVAALLSPLAKPPQLAQNYSGSYPDEIREFRERIADSPVIQWVNRMYQHHRDQQ